MTKADQEQLEASAHGKSLEAVVAAMLNLEHGLSDARVHWLGTDRYRVNVWRADRIMESYYMVVSGVPEVTPVLERSDPPLKGKL